MRGSFYFLPNLPSTSHFMIWAVTQSFLSAGELLPPPCLKCCAPPTSLPISSDLWSDCVDFALPSYPVCSCVWVCLSGCFYCKCMWELCVYECLFSSTVYYIEVCHFCGSEGMCRRMRVLTAYSMYLCCVLYKSIILHVCVFYCVNIQSE